METVAAFAGHFRGLEENAGADHGADDDCAGSPGAEAADEFEALFGHDPPMDFDNIGRAGRAFMPSLFLDSTAHDASDHECHG